jgi:hypothetical protein
MRLQGQFTTHAGFSFSRFAHAATAAFGGDYRPTCPGTGSEFPLSISESISLANDIELGLANDDEIFAAGLLAAHSPLGQPQVGSSEWRTYVAAMRVLNVAFLDGDPDWKTKVRDRLTVFRRHVASVDHIAAEWREMTKIYSVFAVVWLLVSALVVVVVDRADGQPQSHHSAGEWAMINDTPLLSVGKKTSLGNYASIPGTGPHGAVCATCSHLITAGKTATCGKFQALTGRRGKPIDTSTAACRYYQHRPAFAERTPSWPWSHSIPPASALTIWRPLTR